MLSIPPVIQQTYVWCWVAVGQMVFSYYRVPNVNPAGNYQCGIIGALAAGTPAEICAYDCGQCIVPAGSARGMLDMLVNYPRRVAALTRMTVPKIKSKLRDRPLTPRTVRKQIKKGRPIVAGISPSGRPPEYLGAEHVALIIGYQKAANGRMLIAVNDPFPFMAAGATNPYFLLGATGVEGAYMIDYETFRSQLQWNISFKTSRRGYHKPPLGGACCTNVGICPLISPLPLGSACYCPSPPYVFYGAVCQ